jgi:hypothetical protein
MASYNDYLANRRVWATIKKEMQIASVTVFTQMQQLLAYDVAVANVAHASASAAAAMANAAAATANAAAETASEAAVSANEAIGTVTEYTTAAAAHAATASASAAEAAAIVQELNRDSNEELIDKIEYLFMMFYHTDSNTIMENYPLAGSAPIDIPHPKSDKMDE